MCVRLTDRALRLTECASGDPIRLKQCAPETALYCAFSRASLQAATVSRRAAEEVRLIGETGDLLALQGGEIVKRDRLLLRQSGEMGKTALDAQADLTFYRLVQGLALLHQITPTMLRASVAAAHRTDLSSACPCVAML